jgi:hypothetical protein
MSHLDRTTDPPKGVCDGVLLGLATPDDVPSMWPPGWDKVPHL